ncbi:hypothetical protein ES703_84830 [subsurface metagenome]
MYGPTFYEGQEIQTGVIDLNSIYVNKSYSSKFELVNSSTYSWNITSDGSLVVSGLNYTETGDVFKVCYFATYPVEILHPLNRLNSNVESFKVINKTGFEYTFVEGVDYKLSQDGYKIYFFDLYNTILEDGNFTIYDLFEIKYPFLKGLILPITCCYCCKIRKAITYQ